MSDTRRRSTRRENNEDTSRRSSKQTSGSTRSDVFTGNAAQEESKRVVEEAKRKREEAKRKREEGYIDPYRFYMKIGDEKSFIVLDEKPTFYRWEHEDWDSRKNEMNHYGCVAATDNCPACDNLEKQSYFAMYLTIIDLTPFKTQKGETIEFSKKLLVVKPGQHKVFNRKAESEGSLRGLVFNTYKDDQMDPRIGGTIEMDEKLEEEELEEYTREYTDRDGKVHTEDVEPFDYFKIFPETTVESLEEIFGVAPAAGSSREAEKELKDDWGDDKDEENPVRGATTRRRDPPKRGRGARPNKTEDRPVRRRRT